MSAHVAMVALLAGGLVLGAWWPPLAGASGPAPARAASPAATRWEVVADRSEARYRVREHLATLSLPNDAVGATRAIEGALVLDDRGRVVPGTSRFTVDLRTIRSDESRRDNYLRRVTLETDRYPLAVFVPTEVRGLPQPLPASGATTFELVGEFTLRDVTRPVTWNVTATFGPRELTATAATAIHFDDFRLSRPRVSIVLSVDDTIRLELELVLRREERRPAGTTVDGRRPAAASRATGGLS